MMSKKSAHPKISIHLASQRPPLNLKVNYVTVITYTCTYQISYKTEIFKNFYSLHFYLDLLLIKYAYYVEFISCFASQHGLSRFVMNWQWNSTVIL